MALVTYTMVHTTVKYEPMIWMKRYCMKLVQIIIWNPRVLMNLHYGI